MAKIELMDLNFGFEFESGQTPVKDVNQGVILSTLGFKITILACCGKWVGRAQRSRLDIAGRVEIRVTRPCLEWWH